MQKTKSKINVHLRFALVFLFLFFLCLGAILHQEKNESGTVTILCDGALFAVCDVNENQEITIDQKMTIVIQDGQVFVSHSECAGQDCVKQGKSRSLPIICLPQRIEILFEESEWDGIVK